MRSFKSMRTLSRNSDGHIAIPATVLLVGLAALIGGVHDLYGLYVQRTAMTVATRTAALEAVQATAVIGNQENRIAFGAQAHVASRISGMEPTTETAIDMAARTVTLDVSAPTRVRFPGPLSLIETVSVTVTADLVETGGDICLVALGFGPQGHDGRLIVDNGATLSAPDCIVHANQPSASAFDQGATKNLDVRSLQRAASEEDAGKALPAPFALAPALSDTLSDLPPPAAAFDRCDFTDLVITGHETLSAGTYCGGLTIDGGTVDLYAGTYILRDGPLRVMNGGRLKGDRVAIYLDGPDAVLDWQGDSDLSLSAPIQGDMAGLLVRAAPPRYQVGSETAPVHRLASNNAHRLTGMIYLPHAHLSVRGAAPIADLSHFTLIAAGAVSLEEDAHLVLNTNYTGSDVPVPAGFGPMQQFIPTLRTGDAPPPAPGGAPVSVAQR